MIPSIGRCMDTPGPSSAFSRSSRQLLDAFEEQVCDLFAEGFTPEEIARERCTTEGDIQELLAGICQKLRLSGALELILYRYSLQRRSHV
jgi:DNA-binding NarL/FixJ family response regulator